jgi:hypothetical protein
MTDASMPVCMYETGPDEGFLVGTPEDLRKFAQRILAQVEKTHPVDNYLGIPVRQTGEALTVSLGDFCIDGLCIVQSEEHKRELINRIRVNNGEPEIAPEAWD